LAKVAVGYPRKRLFFAVVVGGGGGREYATRKYVV
jgi:hypothetical protein